MKKYTLTKNKKEVCGVVLYQIRATRDIKRFGVKKGDLGGWISARKRLDQDGDAWVSGDARVYGDAWVSGYAWASGNCLLYTSPSPRDS